MTSNEQRVLPTNIASVYQAWVSPRMTDKTVLCISLEKEENKRAKEQEGKRAKVNFVQTAGTTKGGLQAALNKRNL